MAKFVPQPELSLNDQMQIRREKLAALQAEGRDPFVQTKFDFNADSAAIKADYEAFEGKTVKVAGRLMSKRGQGKVMFCDLQDRAGRIQIFVKIDELGEEEYNRFKKYDIGDIVGVEGEVFKTKTEEISIRAKVVTLLSKSLLPLPNKFHGLTDKEARFRQRYVDLMVNPEVKRNFVIRSKFIKHLRSVIKDYHDIFTGNVIATTRLKGVGLLSREDAISLGVTGGSGRASGWANDVRKHHPYAVYDKVDFKEILYTEGDSFARYMVRMDEIMESCHIIEQLIDNIPAGEFRVKTKPIIKIPEGNYSAAVESSRGEFGVMLESHGDKTPYRLHYRSTGLPLVHALDTVCKDNKIADLIAIGGTMDYVIPDIDR